MPFEPSNSSAFSTMPTAPSTILKRAAMIAVACWRWSIACAISGEYARCEMRASITWTPAFARRSWIACWSDLETSAVCVESASSVVGVRIVRIRLRDRADRGLALHGDVLLVVVDLEQRLGRLNDLPDDDRGDLDRVAAIVVHLELLRLEVADPQRDLALGEEGIGKPEARRLDRALVAAEEDERLGVAGVHDEQPAEQDAGDDEDEEAEDHAARPLRGGRGQQDEERRKRRPAGAGGARSGRWTRGTRFRGTCGADSVGVVAK